jgi:uncharacterized protein with NRDE domain
MCLILLAYRAHPGYELVVAANRDEFYDRPTAPLGFWDDAPEVLAGRDLKAGGAWLGITRTGRFAALTNYRDPSRVLPDAPSRGQLVGACLQGALSGRTSLERLAAQADAYNGFNLLLGDGEGLFYTSSLLGEARMLEPGLYGLSNHLLDTQWPKLRRGLAKLREVLDQRPNPDPDELLSLLTDRATAPDAELPRTGVSLEWERWLSPMFIEAPGYGTRSSTVLLVSDDGRARMVEMTWDDGSRREFHLDWPRARPA